MYSIINLFLKEKALNLSKGLEDKGGHDVS